MINADAFASTAREILSRGGVPFRKNGKDLRGMDSAGFIEYCLRQNGVSVSYTGTNDLYRNGGSVTFELSNAIRRNLVVPGALLLHVEHDGGEPEKYKRDGLGNCDFAMICVNATTAIYPSQTQGKLIDTPIKIAPGRANILMYSKYIEYGPKSTGAPSSNSGQATVNIDSLNLRETPDGVYMCKMPLGTTLQVLGVNGDWTHVVYSKGNSQFKGWCKSEYLL